MAQLRDEYNLQVTEQSGIFAAAPPAVLSDWLRETLRKQTMFYGSITVGELWQFLRLEGTAATIDSDRYALGNVEKIAGILLSMLR